MQLFGITELLFFARWQDGIYCSFTKGKHLRVDCLLQAPLYGIRVECCRNFNEEAFTSGYSWRRRRYSCPSSLTPAQCLSWRSWSERLKSKRKKKTNHNQQKSLHLSVRLTLHYPPHIIITWITRLLAVGFKKTFFFSIIHFWQWSLRHHFKLLKLHCTAQLQQLPADWCCADATCACV